jgi:tetratricopeptide (TPR) repeat protein
MCKPTVVTLPFVLILLDYWPLRRFGEDTETTFETFVRRARGLLIEKIPFFILSAGSCAATLLAQESAVMAIRQLSIGDRIGNAMVSYVTYIGQMFWPAGLALFYPYPPGHVNVGQVVFACLLFVVISVNFFLWRRRAPFLWMGWLWFLGMLVPMIGLIQVGEQARADRYTYLSQIGLYILVTWGTMKLFQAWSRGREALAIIALLIVVGLAGRSYAQTSFWRDSETLWKQTLAHTTNNYIAENNLAKAVMLKGKLDEAAFHFRKALELCRNCPEVYNNLGHVLARKGEWAEAATAYQHAVREWPQPNAHYNNNLGISLAKIGKTGEAVEQFQQALQIDPDYREAHSNLAVLLLQLGRRDEAILHFKEVLRLKPDDEQTKAQLRQLGVEI